MVSIHVNAKGITNTMKMLDGISSTFEQNINKLLHELGEEVVVQAGINLYKNGNVVTEELLRSIRILDEGDKVITVGSDSFYAEYIEYGRGPVFPVRAKMLHWVDPQTGKDVFRPYSGPTEPSPFLEPAVIAKTKKWKDVYIEKQNQLNKSAIK